MEMGSWMMIGAAGAGVALVVGPMLRPNPKKRALELARHTGDLGPLIAHVEQGATLSKVDAWDQLFLELWQRYDRELAAKLMIEVVQRHDAKIFHHWIKQVLEIEPELAQTVFTQEFLATHFRPELAMQCGKCGCKG